MQKDNELPNYRSQSLHILVNNITVQNEYSRRVFLRRFALLSSAALLLEIGNGCGPTGVYGPPPVNTLPTINSIYYKDTRDVLQVLAGSQDVPVHTMFQFVFSIDMKTAALPTVSFFDSSNTDVTCDKIWTSSTTLDITPSVDLLHNTSYDLRMGSDAVASNGNNIYLNQSSYANFRTSVT